MQEHKQNIKDKVSNNVSSILEAKKAISKKIKSGEKVTIQTLKDIANECAALRVQSTI